MTDNQQNKNSSNEVGTGSKSFVAENLNKMGASNAPVQTGKNLVFVRKGQPNSQFNNHRSGPKKHGVRKVTSEYAIKKEHVIPPLAEGNIRIVPLGGVQEVGKNMTAIEYGDDIIIIDAGLQFKTEDTPGIDYILPNTKYLEQRKGKIRGLVITHGHLDHIGAIPFIMEALGNPPIYTREFGALLIRKRQAEFPHLPELNIKIITKDVGFFPISKDIKLKFFGVTHAIPESTGVIVE